VGWQERISEVGCTGKGGWTGADGAVRKGLLRYGLRGWTARIKLLLWFYGNGWF